jgi:uncharacterized protein YeeX (DUF496 family)
MSINVNQTIATLNNLNMNGTISKSSTEHLLNVHTAQIVYETTLNQDANGSFFKLYDAISGNQIKFSIIFTGTAGVDGDTITFLKGLNTEATVVNLKNAINNYVNFSASVSDSIITVTQKTNLTITSNSNPSGDGFTKLMVGNFLLNSMAAIPSETIGTYQLIYQMINDLSGIKKKIRNNEKVLIKNLENTTTFTNSTPSIIIATHQSIFHNTRNDLIQTVDNNTYKPSILSVSSSPSYSEDAIFTILGGIGYEILKLKNLSNGNNNGGGSGYAGIVKIPAGVLACTVTGTGLPLTNVTATLKNLNMTGTISSGGTTTNLTYNQDTIGLYQLIDKIINDLSLINKEIKSNERNIITNLTDSVNSVNSVNVEGTLAIYDSIIYNSDNNAVKLRSGFVDDNAIDNRKPSILSTYSEDAVFGLLSSLSYELIKLNYGINGTHWNTTTTSYAGISDIEPTTQTI